MEIIADFYLDFMNLNLGVIKDLKSQGFHFEEYNDWKEREEKSITKILFSKNHDIQETDLISAYEKDLVFDFANLLERIPEPVPRIIHKCSRFTCPEQYQEGVDLLESEIKNGNNLLPHLSRDIYDTTKIDKMLSILGITHFHLGTKQHQKKPLLIETTVDILYAFIHKQDCYFIVIDKHGRWLDEELLHLLYNDFPEALSPWKLQGVSLGQDSASDRKFLWEKNVTTLIPINNEAYIHPGWGTSTAGTSVNARFNLDRYIHYLDCLEKKLILFLNQQHKKMEADFNKKIERMSLFLFQTDPAIMIVDKENDLLIEIIHFDDDNLSIRIAEIIIT
jgi:hypothetical protein